MEIKPRLYVVVLWGRWVGGHVAMKVEEIGETPMM